MFQKVVILFLSLAFFASLSAETVSVPAPIEEKDTLLIKDEIEALTNLIEVTEKRLAFQKKLKEKMVEFQLQKAEFILGNQTQKHAFSMVSNARYILGDIKQDHLSYLFSPEYLDELMFFSSIAGKSSPVRP
jgi:hypothetical protein